MEILQQIGISKLGCLLIVAMVMSALDGGEVYDSACGELTLNSAHIVNRAPHSSLSDKSPNPDKKSTRVLGPRAF